MIDSYTILQIAEASGVVLVGLGSTFFSQRAARYSKPTGNGWTAGLGRRLDKQDEALARQCEALTRLEAKMDAHVAWHLERIPRT